MCRRRRRLDVCSKWATLVAEWTTAVAVWRLRESIHICLAGTAQGYHRWDMSRVLMELDPDSGGRPHFKIAKYLSGVSFISSTNTQDPKSEDAVEVLVYSLSLIAGSSISRRSSVFIKISWASRERIWARASVTCEEEFWERWKWRVEGCRR